MPSSPRNVLHKLIILCCVSIFVTSLVVVMVKNPILDILVVAMSAGITSYFISRLFDPFTKAHQQLMSELNQMMTTQHSIQQAASHSTTNAVSEKNKLQSIMSSIQDGIIVTNLAKEVVLINKKAEELTGYTNADVVGKPIDQIIIFRDKGGRSIPSQEYCPPMTTSTPAEYHTEKQQYLVMTGKNNLRSYVGIDSSSATPNHAVDLGWIVVLTDMKEQRDLEAIQLDFVSMASHELRTPLTSIRGYLSVFMEENKDKLNPDQRQFLDRISISANQLGELVENLLAVSKVERGAFVVNASALDWQKILETAVEQGKMFAAQKNISVELELPPQPLPQVMADSIRINEVINNLISNAVNYTKQGGWVKVTAAVQGNQVITSVSDNGVGIPPEAQAHLFTKFFRVSGALDKSSNSKGTGLGLFLSKSIIDMHHGRIWVESQVGKGSTFHFSLPIAPNTPSSHGVVNDILRSVHSPTVDMGHANP